MNNLKLSLKRYWSTPTRLLAAFAVLMVTLGAGGCPTSCDGTSVAPPPPAARGIAFADAAGPYDSEAHPWAPGETAVLPIAVSLLPGEQPGQTVTVTTQGSASWIEVLTPNQDVTLPAVGQKTYLTTRVRLTSMPSAVRFVAMNARRGASPTATAPTPESLQAPSGIHASDKLYRAEITPTSADIPRSGSQTFTVNVWPRGESQGAGSMQMETDSPKVTVTPTALNFNLVRGATNPISNTIAVRVAADTGLGAYNLFLRDGNRLLHRVPIRVTDLVNGPTFRLEVHPSSIDASNNNPVFAYVSVISMNNYSGNVTVTWDSESEVYVNPPTSPVTVNLTPGSVEVLRLEVTRFFGTAPVQITWTGRSPTVTGDKTTTITLNYKP